MNTSREDILQNSVVYQGYWYSDPKIKSLDFSIENKLAVHLEDGRTIIVPLEKYPSILELEPKERESYGVFDNGKSVDIYAADEMYHIRDFMGIPENWMK